MRILLITLSSLMLASCAGMRPASPELMDTTNLLITTKNAIDKHAGNKILSKKEASERLDGQQIKYRLNGIEERNGQVVVTGYVGSNSSSGLHEYYKINCQLNAVESKKLLANPGQLAIGNNHVSSVKFESVFFISSYQSALYSVVADYTYNFSDCDIKALPTLAK